MDSLMYMRPPSRFTEANAMMDKKQAKFQWRERLLTKEQSSADGIPMTKVVVGDICKKYFVTVYCFSITPCFTNRILGRHKCYSIYYLSTDFISSPIHNRWSLRIVSHFVSSRAKSAEAWYRCAAALNAPSKRCLQSRHAVKMQAHLHQIWILLKI